MMLEKRSLPRKISAAEGQEMCSVIIRSNVRKVFKFIDKQIRGKHVYSEGPLLACHEQSREHFAFSE